MLISSLPVGVFVASLLRSNRKQSDFMSVLLKPLRFFCDEKIMERFTFQISDAQPKKHVFCGYRFFLDR